MARQAEADEIEVVCATPHIRPDHEVAPHELESRVEAVNSRLEQEGVATRVAVGGEVAEEEVERLDDETLRRVSLGGSGIWLLIEPKSGPLSDTLLRTVEHLTERGFQTVIAHPERHAAGDFFEQVAALVQRHALIQATAALVAGGPASPTLCELARRGLLHVLGSDAHSSHGGRPVQLSPGLAKLATIDSLKPHLDWIAHKAPRAILDGKPVEAPFAPAA
jgi:tyrosine-protein phosphatase YwqE